MKIYHYPRCSKSRKALALLEEQGIEPEIIKYQKEPPTVDELRAVVQKLGIRPHQLVRKKEKIYKEQYKGQNMDDEAWLHAMVDHPKLIERPIVIKNDKAILGRPPEKVLELLDESSL
ncbi:MAG: arsenate reductase (glutaredoxin) [Bacteroidota bacterium]